MNKDEYEIFRGHLEECVRHLGTRLVSGMPYSPRGIAKKLKPIADFCGVTNRSVSRWLVARRFPVGEVLIKFSCYLDMIGYRVIELERMPKSRRNFAELIGFGVLSSRQAA